jgi:hypothetical protein
MLNFLRWYPTDTHKRNGLVAFKKQVQCQGIDFTAVIFVTMDRG